VLLLVERGGGGTKMRRWPFSIIDDGTVLFTEELGIFSFVLVWEGFGIRFFKT
jgi:hypothetical protein